MRINHGVIAICRQHLSIVDTRRRCCVWCDTEAVTPPQPLHLRGQRRSGRPFRKLLTLINCMFITCLVLAHGPRNRLSYLLTCFDVSSGNSYWTRLWRGWRWAGFTYQLIHYTYGERGNSYLIIPPRFVLAASLFLY